MKTIKNISKFVASAIVQAIIFATVTSPLWSQDTTATLVRHHPASYSTEVRNAKVVYVEGNDLVLKLENGKVEHLVVPYSDRFIINGKSVTVSELKPGTSLTQTITTTTTPRYVNTVRVLKGKVWHVSPHSSKVILTLPDGTNQPYTIPNHAKITVDGRPATVFDLRKGTMLQATIVTDEPQTVVSRNKSVVGQAPPPPTPPMVGVLLFQRMTPPPAPETDREPVATPVEVAAAEAPAAVLPETGSDIPLVGLLGAVAVAMSLGLGVVRRRTS